ncbi:gamma-butyrobetaine hydroxylase-like domain-containing protein [Methylocystis parvus]|uniref:gamma-butyrobetaine hydroxylase-like domain-containing protein n=1 Tax=Methylocystis parvus TaxID=134 RepID=UPI000369D1C0
MGPLSATPHAGLRSLDRRFPEPPLTANPSSDPWPTEIRLLDNGRNLRVAFDDGTSFTMSAELLRVRSPSAEVQGHSPAERKTIGGKRHVAIIAVAPVGNYAIRLDFDDMHRTGIYTWRYLRELGETAEKSFAAYLDELAAKALDRDRPGEA